MTFGPWLFDYEAHFLHQRKERGFGSPTYKSFITHGMQRLPKGKTDIAVTGGNARFFLCEASPAPASVQCRTCKDDEEKTLYQDAAAEGRRALESQERAAPEKAPEVL